MKVTVNGTEMFKDQTCNYGDCIVIDDGAKVVVYDCGSEEMADLVIDYINDRGYSKVDIILSHNDSDHYNGIKRLIQEGVVDSIYTLLLLKPEYIDAIMEQLDAKRRNRESIKKKIIEDFNNIYSLGGNNLKDALDDNIKISDYIKVVGPSKEYLIEAVSKQINEAESDNIDSSTIMNAVSIQVGVIVDDKKMLLTGDACIEALRNIISDYDCIQLSHHGNEEQGNAIFDATAKKSNKVLYFISDNTGNMNAGSDNLDTKGHRVLNTKKDGTFDIDRNTICRKAIGNLGI